MRLFKRNPKTKKWVGATSPRYNWGETMIDKMECLKWRLEVCRENIATTNEWIEYHDKMRGKTRNYNLDRDYKRLEELLSEETEIIDQIVTENNLSKSSAGSQCR